jgi:hypothetical protein
MDNMSTWTAMMVIHYTQQNNGNLNTPVTLEHVMEWIEQYNYPPTTEYPSTIHITSSELV